MDPRAIHIPQSLMGFEVTGSTLGIIGMGEVACKTAQRCKGFEMKILFTTGPDSKKKKRLQNVCYFSDEFNFLSSACKKNIFQILFVCIFAERANGCI